MPLLAFAITAYESASIDHMETAGETINDELFREESPQTADNFLQLVDEGFYDGLSFPRAVANFVLQGGVQRFQAEACILGDRQLPRQHVPRVPVHDRHQIHEAVRERNVGDIGAPDLIGRVDSAIPEQEPLGERTFSGGLRLGEFWDGIGLQITNEVP